MCIHAYTRMQIKQVKARGACLAVVSEEKIQTWQHEAGPVAVSGMFEDQNDVSRT